MVTTPDMAKKKLKEWTEKYKEMEFSYNFLEGTYENLKWIFWRKGLLKKLLGKNFKIIDKAEESIKTGIDLMAYERKFYINYDKYFKIYNAKNKKIMNKTGKDIPYWAKHKLAETSIKPKIT
jgi:hypothetical protein